MKQIRRFCLLVLSFMAVVGCQASETRQGAAAKYAAVRDRFFAQDSFSFHGRTKLLTASAANANAVHFSGQVQGKDVYLNVKLSFPDAKRVDTLSLLSKGPQLYAKLSGDTAWQPVHHQDVSLQQEFLNWNPLFGFRQMDEMKANVLPLRDAVTDDNLEAVRVVLDSNKLKAWLAQQMKEQVGGRIQAARAPRLKAAMSLSDQGWRELEQGARVQAARTREEIDEIIDHMELEAEYTLFYDRVSLLPTQTVMAIRSAYTLDGQRVHEHTEIETFLQNYGQRYQLPVPAGAIGRPAPAKPPALTRP